jgi:hypothetical protein
MRVYELTKLANDGDLNKARAKSGMTAHILRLTGHLVKSTSSNVELLPIEQEAVIATLRKL